MREEVGNMRKRIVSLAVALVLCLSCLAVPALADDPYGPRDSGFYIGMTLYPFDEPSSGDGWSYDGNYTMTLCGIQSTYGESEYGVKADRIQICNPEADFTFEVQEGTENHVGYINIIYGGGTSITESQRKEVTIRGGGTLACKSVQLDDVVLGVERLEVAESISCRSFTLQSGYITASHFSVGRVGTPLNWGMVLGGCIEVDLNNQPSGSVYSSVMRLDGMTKEELKSFAMMFRNREGEPLELDIHENSSYGGYYAFAVGDYVVMGYPPCDHVWGEWEVETPATCGEAGTEVRRCEKCNLQDARDIPATGEHTPNGNTDCAKATYCTVCGAELKAAGAHTWDAGTQTAAPTCTAAGETTYHCVNCDAVRTEPIAALGHQLTYTDDGAQTITETCGRAGCGHTASAALSAQDGVYTGRAVETASVTCGEGWSSGAPEIVYADNVYAGTAEASVTLGEARVSVNFTIAKAPAHTLTLGNLSQYSGSVSPVTWTVDPADETARVRVEYQVDTPASPCTHVHDESCGENGETCAHVHDDACGYAEAGTAWTEELPAAVGSYPVRARLIASDNLELAAEDVYAAGTLTISRRSSGGSSGGSSGSSADKTEITKNPDGSTTETVTASDGTVTETTRYPDGSREVVETEKDGTVTTTITKPDGSRSTTVEEDGRTETAVRLSLTLVEEAAEAGEAAALPMQPVSAGDDAGITVDLPGGRTALVEIPVEDVTPGTVAVLVKDDGTEEILKTTLTTENGVTVTLTDGDTVKIVDNTKTFLDVPAGYWGADAVAFAASRELFNGTSETAFSPDRAMNRAMFVTVLARLEGVDTSAGEPWYAAGQQWAMEYGVSDGSNMERNLTREQLVTMLWRYAGSPAPGTGLEGYTDAGSVSAYARQAMAWAVEQGIVAGTSDTTLTPQGNATRAQVAAILMRYIGVTAR